MIPNLFDAKPVELGRQGLSFDENHDEDSADNNRQQQDDLKPARHVAPCFTEVGTR